MMRGFSLSWCIGKGGSSPPGCLAAETSTGEGEAWGVSDEMNRSEMV